MVTISPPELLDQSVFNRSMDQYRTRYGVHKMPINTQAMWWGQLKKLDTTLYKSAFVVLLGAEKYPFGWNAIVEKIEGHYRPVTLPAFEPVVIDDDHKFLCKLGAEAAAKFGSDNWEEWYFQKCALYFGDRVHKLAAESGVPRFESWCKQHAGSLPARKINPTIQDSQPKQSNQAQPSSIW